MAENILCYGANLAILRLRLRMTHSIFVVRGW